MPRRCLPLLLPWLALLPLGLASQALRAAPASVFNVNSALDEVDNNIGNGLCETGAIFGGCTLRAAIQEANANPGPDTIHLPAGTFVLTRSGAGEDASATGDLDITGTVDIIGAGPLLTLIDGNGGLTADRVLEIHSGSVTLSGVALFNGHAAGPGGGLYQHLEAALTLTHTIVRNNVAAIGGGSFGGGIFSEGALTLFNSTVSTNTNSTVAAGGGLVHVSYTPEHRLMLDGSTVSGNTAQGIGGGLYAASSVVTVTNSTLNHNQAQYGGGLYLYEAVAALVNTTLSGNSASHSGGGLLQNGGAASLYNVTVTDNFADSDATSVSSSGGTGGGVAQFFGTLNFRNTLIADNCQLDPFGGGGVIAVSDDCAGTLTSQGNNLVGTTVGGQCAISGDFSLVSPLLGPLAYNGGVTRTHALLPGSRGIEEGAEAGCTDWAGLPLWRDQRGVPRPQFGGASVRCDIGAFEVVGPLFVPLVRR